MNITYFKHMYVFDSVFPQHLISINFDNSHQVISDGVLDSGPFKNKKFKSFNAQDPCKLFYVDSIN